MRSLHGRECDWQPAQAPRTLRTAHPMLGTHLDFLEKGPHQSGFPRARMRATVFIEEGQIVRAVLNEWKTLIIRDPSGPNEEGWGTPWHGPTRWEAVPDATIETMDPAQLADALVRAGDG